MTQYLDDINGPEDLKALPLEALPVLAEEIRDRIVEVMPVNGGHFAPSLGVVEITIALHRVFDFRKDQLTLDVAHQCYPHKMLTGRREWYQKIRLKGGPAGYTRPEESPFDWFMWAHAGTSISTALGMARANHGGDTWSVALIGDGSIPTGVALEALNNWGVLKDEKLIVILNDNDMSIAPSVGGMSNYFKRIKREAKSGNKFAGSDGSNAELGRFFDGFNIGDLFQGPYDGHNLFALIDLFTEIKKSNKGALLHLETVKGKGHREAEKDAYKWHAVGGAKVPAAKKTEFARFGSVPYTKVFADALIKRARRDDKVHAITAAMPSGTGLEKFEAEFPDRFYDVGIAEQHGVAFAAGLAKCGKTAVAAIYSTFLQRAFDQLFQEIALNRNPVLLCMDRAGVVGPDGATHNGCFDIAYTRALPRINIMAPADGSELEDMMNMSMDLRIPAAIRYPRTATPNPEKEYPRTNELELGRADILRRGRHGAVMAYGSMVYHAMEAAEILAKSGIELTVYNARFVRPLDIDMLRDSLENHPVAITVEEHTIHGGFGSACLEQASLHGLSAQRLRLVGIDDEFVEHGTRFEMLEELGLSPARLADRFREMVQQCPKIDSAENLTRESENF
ncbi:MAG: 1-deoxy-D-xylulose-5-phosphate synthase [Planctomycetota bacterium]